MFHSEQYVLSQLFLLLYVSALLVVLLAFQYIVSKSTFSGGKKKLQICRFFFCNVKH